ncbi:MAG: hypothetical protein ABW252_25950 [Polyangiales bacterium]
MLIPSVGVKQPSIKRGSSPTQLEMVELEEHHVLATFRNVAIAVWVDDVRVEAVQRAQQMVGKLASSWSDDIAFVQVFGEDVRYVDAPARQALNALLQSGSGAIRDAPVVYEGSGFGAAAMRAIITGLLVPRSYGFSHRVYSRVEDAALSIARTMEKREPTRHARELCEALERIRERHERAFPTAPHSFIRYKSDSPL